MKDKQIFTILTDKQKHAAIQALKAVKPDMDKPFLIEIKEGSESRSSKQRRLQFKWYRERALFNGTTADHEQRYCKLTHGLPILREDSDAFNEMCERVLDIQGYTMQIALMDYFEVTRLFNIEQNVEYLTAIEHESVGNGCFLTHPDDMYWDALIQGRK